MRLAQVEAGAGARWHEHVLHGCTAIPLAAYLKALAVIRLVAEQAGDPDAAGYWHGDAFVLRSLLSEEDLQRFFLERYEPTPLVAPWNGGSGFHPKDNKEGIKPIASSAAERFRGYTEAIAISRAVLKSQSLSESPKNEQKRVFLEALRGRASAELLRWMDAAVVLSDDDPRYPPLLGTGGNDGRLDFTNNFMQRLVEVFDVATGEARVGALELLEAALRGSATAALSNRAIGQFSPGSAGGPNASSGFEGEPRINPWDFILMLEGAVLLAASAVRRLESSRGGALSAPFTVRSRAATVGGAAADDDNSSRGEIWMPLWTTPFMLDEVSALFSEGRVALGRRPVQDGLDFARAVARLGVDRGITAFQRYGFLMRSGKAFLATPMARVPVRRNVQADLIDELDQREWLSRMQRYARDDRAPNAFRALAAQLDAALFALTQRHDRAAVERVLKLMGRIEASAALSPKLREHIRPLTKLSTAWADHANDGTAEFRIAAALAGLSMHGNVNGKPVDLRLRPHLSPVTADHGGWDETSRLVCWGSGTLERNLASLLHRRRLESIHLGSEREELRSRTGATLDDVQRFLDRNTDDRRIAELTCGLACVDLSEMNPPKNSEPFAIPPAYGLLKPFFTSDTVLHRLDWLPPDGTLPPPAETSARLAADDISAALRLAWARLRARGFRMPRQEPPRPPPRGDGPRLLAALTVPLTYRETDRLLKWLDIEAEDHPVSDSEPLTSTTS